jgi:hypothetical protein
MFAANYFAEKLHADKAKREGTLSTIEQNVSAGMPNVSETKDFSSIADALYGELSLLLLPNHTIMPNKLHQQPQTLELG